MGNPNEQGASAPPIPDCPPPGKGFYFLGENLCSYVCFAWYKLWIIKAIETLICHSVRLFIVLVVQPDFGG